MTREQAEDRILEKAKEIRKIMKEYSPEWSGYINLGFSRSDYGEALSFNNEHWSKDRNYPINAFYKMEIEKHKNYRVYTYIGHGLKTESLIDADDIKIIGTAAYFYRDNEEIKCIPLHILAAIYEETEKEKWVKK